MMDKFILTIKQAFQHFAIFNENAFYYVLFFLKNYWIYLFVVAAISLMFYLQLKSTDEQFINDKRRII